MADSTEGKIPMRKLTPMDIKPAKMLIAYDELVKQPGLYVLRMIRDKYPDKFAEYLNIDLLKEILDKDLEILYDARSVLNPLEWLAISKFDYEANYTSLCKRDKDMYTNMKGTDMMDSIHEFVKTFFITDVYIWTRLYDKRVDIDIALNFGTGSEDDKCKYVTGPLDKVIEVTEPNMVFYPFINDRIWELVRKYRQVVFAIPTYDMNRGETGSLKGQTEEDVNIGYYPLLRNRGIPFLG